MSKKSTPTSTVKFPQYIQDLLVKRYYLNGEAYKNYYKKEGQETTWEEVCSRVARTVGISGTQQYDFYEIMHNMEFLPNSPTLFGAGVPGLTMSACFVLGIEDSIEGWAKAFHDGMKVQTAGGGLGFPLHKLRPAGFPVRGKRARAAGPIEFMHCWNRISKSFAQAVRNGANLGLLKCDHPDLLDFITCKDKDGELSNFNISVAVTDEFMNCVENNLPYNLTWEGKVVKTVDAREVWNMICEHAHKTGEPGIIYWDRMQRDNPHPEEGDLYVNPCSEANLYPFTACNLGSINLAKCVDERTKIPIWR